MGDLSEHFSSSEFACKCGCGLMNVKPALIVTLEEIRKRMGRPLYITSGCRCRDHNQAQGGAENSAHLRGSAVDIGCTGGVDRYNLVMYAFAEMCTGIGVGRSFVHVDIDAHVPRPAIWTY